MAQSADSANIANDFIEIVIAEHKVNDANDELDEEIKKRAQNVCCSLHEV